MKSKLDWSSFSKKKFRNSIKKCSNMSILELDHISWKHLKVIIRFILNFVNIANTYINLSYWPLHFKMSFLIIISKPNKVLYNSSKIFQLIVLLSMLGKLIENVIDNRLQNLFIASNFVYPNQIGKLKHCSTIDTDIFFIHLIHSEWVKSLQTNTLAFDIAQFFPSLNYQLLLLILNKTSFDSRIFLSFSNYLINRKTQYLWNNFVSPFFRVYIKYISPIFHIFEKRTKNLISSITISFLSFVDNGLFILQEKTYEKSNTLLFCSYIIITFLFN